MNNRVKQAELTALYAPTVISLICDKATPEVLEQAFGSRSKYASDIAALRSIYDHGGAAIQPLEEISRLEAYRLFSCLPIPLFYPDLAEQAPEHLTDSEVLGVSKFHAFTAAYLFSWELDIVIKSGGHKLLEPAHDRALVSERRYQMIRRMCELDAFKTANPAMHWILAETSECLLGLKATSLTADRTRYAAQRDYIKGLKGRLRESEGTRQNPPSTFEEELKHYSRWLDAKAREMSEERTTVGRKFKKQYYKPYCAALTTWNSNQWNKYGGRLHTVGIERKKPGPLLGRKYQKN